MNDPRLRLHKTEAIVLKQMDLGEGDRIVTFYTPGQGKLRAVAKGIRKPKSRLAGHLEPLTRCRVLVHKGRELESVSQSETIESNLPLREDLRLLTSGVYMAELVERFTQEGQENTALYEAFSGALAALPLTPRIDLLLRHFELRLLSLAGFEPELEACAECRSPLEPGAHVFSPPAGGVLCPACRGRHSLQRILSLNALKVLRFLANSPLEEAVRLRLSDELHIELEGLIRQYIRYLLEQDLKSTDFLDLVRREAGARPQEPRPGEKSGL